MKGVRLRTCLIIGVLIILALKLCPLSVFCMEPDLSGNAGIIVSIPSGEVLYQKAAHIKYASPFAFKMGLALGIMQCFSGQSSSNAADRIRDYLVKEFSQTPDLDLADLLTPFVTATGSSELILDTDGLSLEADLVAVINQVYADAGAGMRIQNVEQLRSGTVLTSLADVVAVTSYLLQKSSQSFSSQIVPQSPNVVLSLSDSTLEVFNSISKVEAEWVLNLDEHFLAIAEQDDLMVIAAVYDSPEAEKDAAKLLEYVFGEYRAVKLASKGEVLKRLEVPGAAQSIGVMPAGDVVLTLSVEEEGTYEMLLKLYEPLTPPIYKGDVIGDLVVLLNGKEVASIELLSSDDVKEISYVERLWKRFISLIKLLY